MAPPFWLVREHLGQPLMRRTPFVERGMLDDHGPDHRVPEPHLADPLVDHHEMVALGRPERIESLMPRSWSRGPQAAGAVERGEQQQPPRRVREPLDPGLKQPPHFTAGPGRGLSPLGRTPSRRRKLEQRERVALRIVDDAPADPDR